MAKKNAAAQAMAKKRWANTSKADRRRISQEMVKAKKAKRDKA
jgi:hypothetical protein